MTAEDMTVSNMTSNTIGWTGDPYPGYYPSYPQPYYPLQPTQYTPIWTTWTYPDTTELEKKLDRIIELLEELKEDE
jgi:hypothetical protein